MSFETIGLESIKNVNILKFLGARIDHDSTFPSLVNKVLPEVSDSAGLLFIAYENVYHLKHVCPSATSVCFWLTRLHLEIFYDMHYD